MPLRQPNWLFFRQSFNRASSVSQLQRIVDGCYRIRLGLVNAFIIARPGELTLIDTGMPGDADRIERALQSIGCALADVRHILVTHCHGDHAGSLAEVQRRAPAAKTSMHLSDALLVEQGIAMRKDKPLHPSPGTLNQLLFPIYARCLPSRIEPAKVDRLLCDREHLNIAGGITTLHAPGHTQGQACFLWHRAGGVLFAGDTAACVWGLSYSIAYENFELGRQTLGSLAGLEFEYACFGHGKAIVRNADKRFSKSFGLIPSRGVAPELATPSRGGLVASRRSAS